MTILFPGRKLDASNNAKFRDDVTRCIATRIDKRHIVYDYAVSQDNVVFVPTQDEDAWLNDMDWSPFVTLKLYQPDFRPDGQTTNNAILQSVWQMHQDGSLKAVGLGNKPTKQRLPIPATSATKFGLNVEEAEDARSPSSMGMRRSQSDAFPMYGGSGGGPKIDFARQAQKQFYSHSRRVMGGSEPGSPQREADLEDDFAGMPDPVPNSPPRFGPPYESPPAGYRVASPPPMMQMMSQPTGVSMGGYGPPGPSGGFVPPQYSGGWDHPYAQMDYGSPRPGSPPQQGTVLRRRSGLSRRASGGGFSDMSHSGSVTPIRAPSQSGGGGGGPPPERRVRRKLSKRRSRGSLGGDQMMAEIGGGPGPWGPRTPTPMPQPPQMYYPQRPMKDDRGCGCIIC